MAELEDRQAADPLAGLHRMSTTAGAAAQDYVAISNLAILAVLLGAASALAFWGWSLLALPGAGLICGVLALYYIRHSNGTQTGAGLAWAGVVLSLGLGGASVGFAIQQYFARAPDREQISQFIAQLKDAVTVARQSGNTQPLKKLYDERFTQEFKFNVGSTQFVEAWAGFEKQYGDLQELRSTGLFYFSDVGDAPEARAAVIMKFAIRGGDKDGYDRDLFTFEKSPSGLWQVRFTALLFAPPPKRGSQGPN